jgi:hypothetical protein
MPHSMAPSMQPRSRCLADNRPVGMVLDKVPEDADLWTVLVTSSLSHEAFPGRLCQLWLEFAR